MTQSENLYKALAKAIGLAAIAVVLLWLLYKVTAVLLLFLLALVFIIIINAPVSWLEKKGMKRGWASFVVFGIIFLVFLLLGWLVIPRLYFQTQELIDNLPNYIQSLRSYVTSWVADNPVIRNEIKNEEFSITNLLPPAGRLINMMGNYSLLLFSMIFVSILFICIVVYSVSRPRPLLEIYYNFFPPAKREKAQNALIHTSTMLNGWIKANLIGGSIEAVCTTVFLSIMEVPGAWLWGAVVLFAELIPNIGFYIMSVPPTLLALSVSPLTGLWVFIFFIVLSEIMGSFVMPRLIASKMNLHPVSTLFMLLVMGSAFGLIGALLTVPVTAIIKAYYTAFKVQDQEEDSKMDERIDNVLYPQPGK